jgi:hypothetical protein
VAGALSGAPGAQLLAGAVPRGKETGIETHVGDQPLGSLLAGCHVAREVHSAHHALARELGGARQQRIPTLGDQVGE